MTGSETENSRGLQPVIVTFVSVGIAFLVVILRVVTRLTIVGNLGPEDYVIAVSLVSTYY